MHRLAIKRALILSTTLTHGTGVVIAVINCFFCVVAPSGVNLALTKSMISSSRNLPIESNTQYSTIAEYFIFQDSFSKPCVMETIRIGNLFQLPYN